MRAYLSDDAELIVNNDYFRAGNPKTPAEEFRALLTSASAEVRLRLAENVQCPVDVLARLSVDERADVRAAAGSNPSAPKVIIERVAKDNNAEVRMVLASESNISIEILHELTRDVEPRVRERARQTLAGLELESKLVQTGFQPHSGEAARLGDLITMSGILTEEEVKDFLSIAREAGLPLGRVLAEKRAISQVLIVQLLNVQAAIRQGEMAVEEAIGVLERFKAESLSQRQTQQLHPLRSSGANENLPTSSLGIRALIDAAPDGVVIFDEEGFVIEWSKQAEQIMGYTRRQAIGKTFWELLNSSSGMHKNSLEEMFATSMANGSRPCVELVTKDGRGGKIPVEITFSRDESANAPYIAFVRDVSERKRHEDRRSAQYAVTRMLSDATSLAQAGPEMLNLLCETTGWDTAEILLVNEGGDLLTRAASWRGANCPSESRVPNSYPRTVGIPGQVWNNRQITWVDSSNRPEKWSGSTSQTATLGLPIVFQSEFHGVLYLTSRRMRIPEKDSVEMLANCCVQIAQYIQRQRAEKARQHVLLLQQREDFMATLAHDLKTPLISGERVLELLLNGSLGPMAADQSKVLAMLRDSNQALLRMVKNLLAVYRYESGAEQLHLELVDVEQLLNSSLEEVRPMMDAKEIQASITATHKSEPFIADSLELRRVFSNLLSNAQKYTPEGGKVHIRISDEPDSQAVRIDFTDNGIGIAKTEQKNVFRRFWQGNKCHRAIGTGLGLHLCWKIIEAHGGKILCNSDEGKGSTFSIILPKIVRQNATQSRMAAENK